MARKLRTKLPTEPSSLKPSIPEKRFREKEAELNIKQKRAFDSRHAAKPLVSLTTGEKVWVKDRQEDWVVVEKQSDRSYIVKTPKGQYRRNRVHLNKFSTTAQHPLPVTPVKQSPRHPPPVTPAPQRPSSSPMKPSPSPAKAPLPDTGSVPTMVFTRSGRAVQPPVGYRK